MEKEIRTFESGFTIEARAEEGADVPIIRGHAAVFDKLSENLGGFRERIAPGAFDSVLEDDVRALFNHDGNLILGRTRAGTLRLFLDDVGLGYELTPPDTQAGRDLMTSIKRGDVSQSSFAFRVAAGGDSWDEDEDGVIIRTITKFGRLFDVSPVTFPAYPDTSVAARSLDLFKASKVQATACNLDLRRRQLEMLRLRARIL